MSGVVVGIDVGGTKTHLRAHARQSAPVDMVVASADWRTRDWRDDAKALLRLSERLVDGVPIKALAVGAHGCDNAAECKAFECAFADQVSYPVVVRNDAELLPAACGLTQGIGLVAGTGSIAVTRNADGAMLVAGGWGWIIGDEGSASGLVREAGRHVSQHLDMGGSHDEPLVRAIFEALGITSAARVGSTLSEANSAAELGQHAQVVFEAADCGSQLALKVISEGADALVELIARLSERGAEAKDVVGGGGVIVGQPRLADRFKQQMSARFQGQMRTQIFDGAPVEGACRIAMGMAGFLPTEKRENTSRS